jgi:spore germination cell wall hydrolase CwlJ-like protein
MVRIAFLLGVRSAVGHAVAVVLLGIFAQSFAGGAQAATTKEEQRCLAEAMYWEARGEGRRGMIAVGWTVLNRVRSARFPSTPCDVVHQGGERPPCQFNYWCDGRSDRPRDLPSWRSALSIAAQLLQDPPPDPTGGALYFHNSSVRTPRHRDRTAKIGRHVFYR